MEKKLKRKITSGMLILVMILLIFFSTGVFAANEEADNTTTEEIGVAYRGHVQNQGNTPKPEGTMVSGPEALGTRGQSLRVEGFWIELTGNVPEGANIVYEVHVQNEGWMTPVKNGTFAGTTGKSQRVESIKIHLENLPGYDVYYRGHVQNVGNIPMADSEWGWQKNGEELGTTGSSLRLEELQVKLVKQPSTTTTYEKAGTFGPEMGVDIIENDVTINTPDVVLQNLHIKGNLTIGEGVGEGDVTLNNIIVDGETYIRGGGKNSIHINGGEYNKITIQQTSSGQVRIVATDATGLEVVVSEDATGEDIILEGAFENVQIDAPDVKISTQGDTSIKEMVVAEKAKGSEITLDEKTTVANLDLNASVEMKGEGTIEKANVNSDNVTFEQKPKEEVIAPEVKIPPVVTPPEPPKPTPTPSGPSAEDLLVAEYNNAKSINAIVMLLYDNRLGLDLKGYTNLDFQEQCVVGQTLLDKNGFVNKAALQAAVTGGIKLAQDDAQANAYMKAVFSYTPELSVQDQTWTISYPEQLTNTQQSLLSGLYADLIIILDKPLTDGEALDLAVNGTTKQLTNKNLVGQEIQLSKLLGRNLGAEDLVQNQKSTVTVTVKDVSTKIERSISICPITTKNGEEYFKNFTNACAIQLSPFWLKAYADSVVIDCQDSEFLFNYSGNLTEIQKQALSDYYADTIIQLNRPLGTNESIKVSALGKEATLTSNTIMDNEWKTEIRLSKLLGIRFDSTNLAINQKGTQQVSLTDLNLTQSNGISVNAVLAKTTGSPLYTGRGYGCSLYPNWMDEYMSSVSTSTENSKIVVSYDGNLSSSTKTSLKDYKADVMLSLSRDLEEGETVTVSALNKTVTLTNENYNHLLSELTGVTQEAANKSGDDPIEFTAVGLKHNLNIYANPVLVNSNETVYLNNGTTLPLYQPSFKAYSDSIALISTDNKFLVTYKGGLSADDLKTLDGYYADAMIYLDRALGENETVTITAFSREIVISKASPAEDSYKQSYRLSKLLELELGDANLAAKQTGSFEVAIIENTLEKQLTVSADAILVKNNTVESLNNSIGMTITPPSFTSYENSVMINSDNTESFTISHQGGLSPDDAKNLAGLYGDTVIMFQRTMQFGESIKISAYGKEAVITSTTLRKWSDSRIGLTELLGIAPDQAPLATSQGNDIKISFSEANLKSPMSVSAFNGLIKADGTWLYRASSGIGFNICPPFMEAYTNNINLESDANKISVTYLDKLTQNDKLALDGYYSDAMINLSRPLVDDEAVTINAFGSPVTVDRSKITDNNGTQIRLSDLLGLTLGANQLAANQTGGFEISVTNNSLKSNLTITAEAILTKNDDLHYMKKYATLELQSEIFETAVAAYSKSLSVTTVDNQFKVTYEGNLSEVDKAGLNGFYANAFIYLNRSLVAGEEVTVNAFGQNLTVNSSMIKESEGNRIRLSQLLGLTLGEDQLAANQKGGFDITVTDKSLKSELIVTAESILVKGDEIRGLQEKMVSMLINSQAFENAVASYTESIKVEAADTTFKVSYAGNLSEADKNGLNGYYANAWICLSRPLQTGEEILVHAFDRDIPVNCSTFIDETGQYINLSNLLGINLDDAQLAANQQGTFEIKVTDQSLKSEVSISAFACLTKGDARRMLAGSQTAAAITLGASQSPAIIEP
ncbi:hypothetical protein [Acetobacterium wieringae]|uniref:hypothetical protein n=1 Tax=Acetobacterium wieringae TaxID=52694 RepID=UPI00203433F2|nr:hypothetical protein [Acetobacterium wieringae]URN84102.1 hypothetical protein CHL1_003275 [Acetobacterium wieringae]